MLILSHEFGEIYVLRKCFAGHKYFTDIVFNTKCVGDLDLITESDESHSMAFNKYNESYFQSV